MAEPLLESEDAFEDWNNHCDNIDKQYAPERLAATRRRQRRDKEFQMFWANCEVLKPSIYAKPPVPVVAPKFKDRRPVYQQASEVMERCCIVAFDLARINDLMLLVRDDLAHDSAAAWRGAATRAARATATTTTRRSASTSRAAATSCTRSAATGAR